MRTLRWILIVALPLLSLPALALAQDEPPPAATDEEVPEASDIGPSQKPEEKEDESTAKEEDEAAATPKKPISLGLLLGYGLSLENGKNPWGLGFGARAGYNLDAVYLGVRFAYYLGATETAMALNGTIKASVNIWELGVEGGYDLAASDTFIFRPELGLGIASYNVTTTPSNTSLVSATSNSKANLFFAPGIAALYDVTPSVFLGIDLRLMIIVGTSSQAATSTVKGFMMFANGGVRF